MIKVELIERFNMTCGIVLIINNPGVLKVGDIIVAGDLEYRIKGFMFSLGALEKNVISVQVEEV